MTPQPRPGELSALEAYCEFFAGLRPADLERLQAVFTEDARFRDPFNDVRGRDAIRAVFEHPPERWAIIWPAFALLGWVVQLNRGRRRKPRQPEQGRAARDAALTVDRDRVRDALGTLPATGEETLAERRARLAAALG